MITPTANTPDTEANILNQRFINALLDHAVVDMYVLEATPQQKEVDPFSNFFALINLTASFPLHLYYHPTVTAELSAQLFKDVKLRSLVFDIAAALRYVYGEGEYSSIVQRHLCGCNLGQINKIGSSVEENTAIPTDMRMQLDDSLQSDALANFLLANPWLVVLTLLRINLREVISIVDGLRLQQKATAAKK